MTDRMSNLTLMQNEPKCCVRQARLKPEDCWDSHATLQLRPHLLIHLDQAAAVINEHAVQLALLDVHTKDKIQFFGFLQCPGRE